MCAVRPFTALPLAFVHSKTPRMPKHKELFADDYYDNDDLHNPYAQEFKEGDDSVQWDKP